MIDFSPLANYFFEAKVAIRHFLAPSSPRLLQRRRENWCVWGAGGPFRMKTFLVRDPCRAISSSCGVRVQPH
jgi:hypothetical protein